MSAGMVALISIAGLGWLGSSFFEGNKQLIVRSIPGLVQQHLWVFALGLFVLSILLASQAATLVTLMPVALGLGLGAPALIAMFPAVNGYFFLPTYATMLAAISFDKTGTTRIGKYVLNHSFMLPGSGHDIIRVHRFFACEVVFKTKTRRSLRHKWTNVRLSDKGSLYCRNQVGLHVGLEDVSQCAFCHACLHELLLRMDRQEHYFSRRRGLAQSVGRINSTQNRHGDVGHNYVGTKAESLRD
jgi:Anaerobic c4-dicarboxylate membrane transporter